MGNKISMKINNLFTSNKLLEYSSTRIITSTPNNTIIEQDLVYKKIKVTHPGGSTLEFDMNEDPITGTFIISGKIIINSTNGYICETNIKNGNIDGECLIKSRIGVYNGFYKNGKFCDNGMLLLKNGTIVTLVFGDETIVSYTITYKNGDKLIIDGENKVNKIIYNNGDVFEGLCTNSNMTYDDVCNVINKPTILPIAINDMKNKNINIFNITIQEGKMTYKNGDVYEGSFLNDKYNGKGKLTTKYSDIYTIYEGQFIDNMFNGYGIFTTYSNIGAQDKIITGFWKNGLIA